MTERRLPNGLSIRIADMPGRPLVSAVMVIAARRGRRATGEAGATVLAARALTEGTERYDAIALIEASERLGASLHAEAGWDALSVGVDVPAPRLEPALELVAEVLLRPTFPEPEVERLRDERLNDLLQAQADPRRRAEVAFVDTIYAAESPYHRPSGGTRETVEGLDRRRPPWRVRTDPRSSTGDARDRWRSRRGRCRGHGRAAVRIMDGISRAGPRRTRWRTERQPARRPGG